MWHLAEICLDLRVLENDAPRKELCPHLLIKTATIIAPKLPLLNYIVIVTQGSAVLLKVANWKQKCTYSHFERQKFLVRRWSWWRIGCGWLGPTPMIPLNLMFVKGWVLKSPKLLFPFADISHRFWLILAMGLADLWGIADLHCQKVESTKWLKHREPQ